VGERKTSGRSGRLIRNLLRSGFRPVSGETEINAGGEKSVAPPRPPLGFPCDNANMAAKLGMMQCKIRRDCGCRSRIVYLHFPWGNSGKIGILQQIQWVHSTQG